MNPGDEVGLPSTSTERKDQGTARARDEHLWALAHTERATLAEDLSILGAEQWRHDTLCAGWDVEQVVAHLTTAANVSRWQWLRSMLGARFRPDVYNQRRLAEHLGGTPAETLDRFRAVITSTTAPSGDTPAWLGEVLVHAQDIRRPRALPRPTRRPGCVDPASTRPGDIGLNRYRPPNTQPIDRCGLTDHPKRHRV